MILVVYMGGFVGVNLSDCLYGVPTSMVYDFLHSSQVKHILQLVMKKLPQNTYLLLDNKSAVLSLLKN